MRLGEEINQAESHNSYTKTMLNLINQMKALIHQDINSSHQLITIYQMDMKSNLKLGP